jgi:O-antigen ligase
LLVWQGAVGVVDQPFGHGPGTAGLASIQNPGGGQLTENYYLQIAYEIGLLGLFIFIALNFVVYYQLLQRKDWLGMSLLAAFWGYVLMNMLLHTWSNEAVAAQWWLLAGAAIALVSRKKASGTSVSTKRRADS